MKPLLAVPSVVAILLASTAVAQAPLPTRGGPVEVKPSGTPGKATGERTLRVTATIYRIDVPTRIVVLENEYGGYETIKVGPAVTGLDRFAPGDTVTVELQQGLALEFQPPGSKFVPPSDAAKAAPAPADKGTVATASGGMQSTVTITAIDAKRRVVTFQGPGGNVYRVKAGQKVKLDGLAVGDKLLATYTETIALKLEKKAN